MVLELLPMAVIAFGIIMNSSLWFQAYKIIKRKSSRDVSLLTYSILTPGYIIWLIYGITIGDPPLIICNIVGTLAGITTMIVTIIYRSGISEEH